MSGHSKWTQIKRQKGVADQKRGQVFTKLSNAITIAVKGGGQVTDPEQNFRLRLAIEKAREANMPKMNIERAIEKGKGLGEKGEELQEAVYEGFGPGNVGFIVEVTTDKIIRSTTEVKNIFSKNGGALASQGAVSYQFAKKGLITVLKGKQSFDEVLLIAADCGADDIEDAGDRVLIYTQPEELNNVKNQCIAHGLQIEGFEFTRKPTVTILIEDKETAEKIFAFIEKLEELDDVQKVYSNFDITKSLEETI